MARVTVEDCIDKVDSPYELVLVAKERATQLNSGIEPTLDRDNDKNTVIALREIADENIKVKDLTGKFTPNEILVGYARATTDTNAYRINTINYDDDTATYDQNVDFQSSGDSILDFTEQNPFGEL